MRFNSNGQIALDWRGAAVATWLNDQWMFYQREMPSGEWWLVKRQPGATEEIVVSQAGANAWASWANEWMARLDGYTPELRGSTAWRPSNGRVGDISDGVVAVLDSEMTTVTLQPSMQTFTRTTPFGGLRLSRNGHYAVWVSFPGPTVVVWDCWKNQPVTSRTLPEPQYTPVILEHRTGVWLAYQTDHGGVLHRLDDCTQGYRWGTAQFIYDPDLIAHPTSPEGCLVGWCADPGQFVPQTIFIPQLGANMVPLTQEPPTMTLPSDVRATIVAFEQEYPLPQGDGSDAWMDAELRPWMRRLWEQLRFSHGAAWGGKARSADAPPSKDAVACCPSLAELHVWDILTGAGTGRPTLSAEPTYYFVPDQYFIAVPPVDHLAPVPSEPRRPITVPCMGISAFDLGCRLIEGDKWFLDLITPLRLVPRVVNASAFRTPRTPSEGLAHMQLTLNFLHQRGLQGQFVLLCDTAEFGMTKAQARDIVREANAIARRFPGAVYGLQLANENSHSVEQPWLRDKAFLRELAALIDVNFPVSFGAGHGGESVLTGGSYLTHHSDRSQTPAENALVMREAQAASGCYVIDDEPLGIAETARVPGRQRTDDPTYATRLVEAARDAKLGGVTLHMDVGLTCRQSDYGPVQAEALRLFVAAWGRQPPPQGHPILDAALTPADPVGYRFFIANWKTILTEADAWFRRHRKAHGLLPVAPADTDLGHGLWRGLNEGERWRTLRGAWEETWPGGQP